MSEIETEHGAFRQRGFIASAAVLAVLVVLGVVVTLLTVFDGDASTPTPAAPSSSSDPTKTPTDPAASRCGLEGLDKSGTLSQPPDDVTWELVGTIAIPASEDAGPGVIEDSGLRYCYAHTPEGALLMAANTLTWSEVGSDEILANSVASGPGREAAEAEWNDAADNPEGNERRFQITAFKLSAYTDEAAMVDLVIQSGEGQLVSMPMELAWENGDWRLRLTPDGSLFNGKALPDLTGYVLWSGA
jgi:hypothetical protein